MLLVANFLQRFLAGAIIGIGIMTVAMVNVNLGFILGCIIITHMMLGVYIKWKIEALIKENFRAMTQEELKMHIGKDGIDQ